VKKVDQSNRPTRSPEDPFAAWNQYHLKAHKALREKLFEELNEKTERCEARTRLNIRNAETIAKLERLHKGVEKWTQALCDAVASFYPECAQLLSCNSADLAEYHGTPYDLARDWTVLALGYFLGMPDLDGNAPNPDSRVRKFIGHACGIYPNDIVAYVESPAKFQLPSWARRSSLGARIAPGDTASQEEFFIRGAEEGLASTLLRAIDRARQKATREATIAAGMNASPARGVAPPHGIASKRGAKKRKGRPKDPLTQTRALKFQEIILQIVGGQRLTGIEYCKALDDRGVTTNPRWRHEGCPRSYVEAYTCKDRVARAKWKHRIWDEKSRIRRQWFK
jgi:hypothetical protein